MAELTGNDINEAKKRVEEMRRRSQNLVEPDASAEVNTNTENIHKTHSTSRKSSDDKPGGIFNSIFSSLGLSGSEDNSASLILALVLILSKEGADSKLILALLYILL